MRLAWSSSVLVFFMSVLAGPSGVAAQGNLVPSGPPEFVSEGPYWPWEWHSSTSALIDGGAVIVADRQLIGENQVVTEPHNTYRTFNADVSGRHGQINLGRLNYFTTMNPDLRAEHAGDRAVVATGLFGGGFAVAWTDITIAPSAAIIPGSVTVRPGGEVTDIIMDVYGTEQPVPRVRRPAATEARIANSFTPGDQLHPDIAALSGGGFVVVWDGFGAGDTSGIFARRFNADGSPAGADFGINSTTNGRQFDPHVSGLADGGFIVTWTGADRQLPSIYARRFSASGAAVGNETNLTGQGSSFSAGSGAQLRSDVAGLTGGGYVISWEAGGRVRAQVFNALGWPVTAAMQIGAPANQVASAPAPVVSALSDGGFVVLWNHELHLGNPRSAVLQGRRYAASGQPDGNAFVVSELPGPHFSLSAAGLVGGGFVASWVSHEIPPGMSIALPRARMRAYLPEVRDSRFPLEGVANPRDLGLESELVATIGRLMSESRLPNRGDNSSTIGVLTGLVDARSDPRIGVDDRLTMSENAEIGLIVPRIAGCRPVPSGAIFWAQFDGDLMAPDAIAGAVPAVPGPDVGLDPTSIPGHGGDVLRVSEKPEHFEFPPQSAMPWAFGSGDLSLELWTRVPARVMEEGADLVMTLAPSSGVAGAEGLWLSVRQEGLRGALRLFLVGSGGGLFVETLPVLSPDVWHHVVLSIDRDDPMGGHFYLDGQPVPIAASNVLDHSTSPPSWGPPNAHGLTDFSPVAASGTLGAAASLVIAAGEDVGGFNIDELVLYSRPLAAADANSHRALPICR